MHVRVRCGDPLDEVVLRSYCIGAAHMALGWVRSEGLAVDDDGAPVDLTIRSFGILRAVDTPPIDVEIEPDDGDRRSTAATPCSPPSPPPRGAPPARPPTLAVGTLTGLIDGTVGAMSKPLGPYTPVVRAGDFIIVSGQLGMQRRRARRGRRRRPRRRRRSPTSPPASPRSARR